MAAQNLPFVLAVVAETLHPSLSLIWLDLLCEVKGIEGDGPRHAGLSEYGEGPCLVRSEASIYVLYSALIL
ncbi:hypothetical protein [Nitrosospira multiformis]|uniref:hypothetical protein n=1 Tax=Nitrosospira multiformis TaxID=1231 RepID=UPI0015A63169|nr:hypothetical protein [Nitrosospira multiformis]